MKMPNAISQPASNLGAEPSPLDAVLIAEDDPVFRRILQSWLQKWNYRVIAVENGVDAWNTLQQDDAPHLVILDWMMPGMDGIELCRKIRGRGEGLYRYVLLLTAKDDKQDVVAGLEAGADDYLTKPFDVDELHARVRAGKRIVGLQHALIQAQLALQFEAAHDKLTGLWNRGAILDVLQREVERGRRDAAPLGVIMADLDHFKNINDSHGHLVGDAVLQEVALRLTASVRCYDYVGRYGGEEFLLVISGCNTPDLVAHAERLRRCIAEPPVDTGAAQIPVTLSIGVVSAQLSRHGPLKCELLIRAADAALYQAKTKGRNRVEAADELLVAGPSGS